MIETNENESIAYKHLWNTLKTVFKRKSTDAYTKMRNISNRQSNATFTGPRKTKTNKTQN